MNNPPLIKSTYRRPTFLNWAYYKEQLLPHRALFVKKKRMELLLLKATLRLIYIKFKQINLPLLSKTCVLIKEFLVYNVKSGK